MKNTSANIPIIVVMNSDSISSVLSQLSQCGQHHILESIPELAPGHPVFEQLCKLDIATSLKYLDEAKSGFKAIPQESLTPVNTVVVWKYEPLAEQERIVNIGLDAIYEGQVAAVIMSGGQGTRLGYAGPKGMYDIGLLSHKPIFQLHIEKLLRLKRIRPESHEASIPIYIMTSDLNDSVIRQYFKDNNYFGYPENEIYFFEQSLQPCFDLNGKLILESSESLALAPDGNGGLYHALKASGGFADMKRRGVKYLHVYGIDNVLTKSADPAFMGLCIDRKIDCGNKVVWRASKSEKVGVTACSGGDKICIVEYSEIPPALAEAVDEGSGRLIYGAANICNHFLSVDFIETIVFPNLCASYHLANKKIAYFDRASRTIITPSAVNGVKLEMFIFDVFPLARRWSVMEIDRDDEFAPVKNAPGDASDSPDTARALMTAQAIRWLQAAGASVRVPSRSRGAVAVPVAADDADSSSSAGAGGDAPGHVFAALHELGASTGHPAAVGAAAAYQCEISPLVSYAGEGLEGFAGETIQLPFLLNPTK